MLCPRQGRSPRRCAPGQDRPRCCAIGKCCGQVLSRRTIADARATLRVALNNAITEELLSRNVAALAKLLRERRRRSKVTKPWSVEEARQFLVSAEEDRDPFYPAYALILVLGLRRGEVLGLTWPLINLDAAELHVGHGLQRIGAALVLGDTKTDASDALLPLPDICQTALRVRQKAQQLDKDALGGPWPDLHDLVFTTRYGSAVDPRNFVRSFKRRCEKAGVRPIRVHGTRHTCESLLAALEVHPP